MSMDYTLTTIVWMCFSLLELISNVEAETCSSGLECDYHEYCCGEECCSKEGGYGYGYGYGFYNLWYFWFVIIMIMMTCCGACSYVKKRQYYIRQQQSMRGDIVCPPDGTMGAPHHHHHQHAPPTLYGLHPGTLPNTGPPVGTFPGPPAYNEVTGKPDQFPKAQYGYPNYGFAAPPYSPPEPSRSIPQSSEGGAPPAVQPPPLAAPTTTTIIAAEGAPAVSYPPPTSPPGPEDVPVSAPPPYTPVDTSTMPSTTTPELPNQIA